VLLERIVVALGADGASWSASPVIVSGSWQPAICWSRYARRPNSCPGFIPILASPQID